jgi:hypothetical protein
MDAGRIYLAVALGLAGLFLLRACIRSLMGLTPF